MVKDSGSSHRFRLSIKSLEYGVDPGVTHAGVQALCGNITRLSHLENTTFAFLPMARPKARPSTQPGEAAIAPSAGIPAPTLYAGLQFEAPLDKFRVILRCLGSWLDLTAQKTLFALELPPTQIITLQTSQAKGLAQLLSLGEALLSPQDLYRMQTEAYIDRFGEITPAAQANLNLARHRVGLSLEEANHLQAQALGPFKNLAEKYQHFRQALLACQQDNVLDSDFWAVMGDKATTMGLPEVDAQFLKAERLATLSRETERAQQQAEAAAESARQQRLAEEQRLANYRQAFADIVLADLPPQGFGPDAASLRQRALATLSATAFTQGRLHQAREFYHLSPPEAETLEATVLDELYSRSGLL